jgi:hypothetical protein
MIIASRIRHVINIFILSLTLPDAAGIIHSVNIGVT